MRHSVALTTFMLPYAAFISMACSQTAYDAPTSTTPGSASDGSISSTYGNTTYTHNLDGSAMICAHYGAQTFCNWRAGPPKP